MTDRPIDLLALAKRTEEGEGEDERVSALREDIAFALGWTKPGRHWRPPPGPWSNSLDLDPPPLLTSLDAVVELAEERLPGWEWLVQTERGPNRYIALIAVDVENFGVAKSPARALLAALLRALAAERRNIDASAVGK